LYQFDNPALTQCISYLERYLKDSKRRIIELLELERRALTYITLTPIPPHYTWGTVAELGQARAELHDQWVNSLQVRGGEELQFQASYTIDKTRNPQFFAPLQKFQPALFIIPTTQAEFNRGKTSFVRVYLSTYSYRIFYRDRSAREGL